MDIFTRLNCLQVGSTPVLFRIVLQEPDDEIIKSGVSPDNIRFDIDAALFSYWITDEIMLINNDYECVLFQEMEGTAVGARQE